MLWADRVTRNVAHKDSEANRRLAEHFTHDEQVELTFATALFALMNRFNDSLCTDMDAGAPNGASLQIEVSDFLRYVQTVYGERGGRMAAFESEDG